LLVVDSPHTAGPAEIHACGGGFGPRHDRVRPGGTRPGWQWSAQESPDFSRGEGQRMDRLDNVSHPWLSPFQPSCRIW
jgi:hypothetical protein